MSAREELAGIIGGKLITRSSMTETADAVLAAGYRKSRTITTAEELDALPVDSVVGDWTGRVYQKDAEDEAPEFPWWMTTGDQRRYPAKSVILPATVLHDPEAQP